MANDGHIHEEAIPGTVHLVDLEHVMATKHATGKTEIILIPTPSNDPNDPLNWAPWRKKLNTACISMCVIATLSLDSY